MMFTTRYLLVLALVALIAAFAGVLVVTLIAGAEEPQKAMPVVPDATIAISTEDALLWERYQLLSRLAAAQQDLLRLQNEKTLAEEYAKLDAQFHAHYKISVNQVERRGDQWIPRQTPPAAPK